MTAENVRTFFFKIQKNMTFYVFWVVAHVFSNPGGLQQRSVASVRTVVGGGVGILQVIFELLVQVFADADVLEHALQLRRVLKAARLLYTSQPAH